MELWTRSNFFIKKKKSPYTHAHLALLVLSQHRELNSTLPYVPVYSTAVSVHMEPAEKTVTSSGLCHRVWEYSTANNGNFDSQINRYWAHLNFLSSPSFCVSGLRFYQITITETVLFLVQYTSKEFDRSEKTVATGDCCYLNPLVRRTFRFLGKLMSSF